MWLLARLPAALVGTAAVAAAAPLAPIAGVLALIGLIGAVCLLPFLFPNSCTVRTTPGYVYTRPSYYQPTIFTTPTVPVFGGAVHHHGHGHIDTGGHGHHHGHHHEHTDVGHGHSHHHGHSPF